MTDTRWHVYVKYTRTTGKHYRGETDVFNVRADKESQAKAIIRRQLSGTGAEITKIERV